MWHNLRTKPSARLAALGLFVLLVGLACDLSTLNPLGVRISGQPEPEKRQLFKGIQYERLVRQSPRALVIHVITIDLKADGIKSLVSPGNPDRDQPSSAKTTSAFLQEAGLQLAINGDAFTPWYDLGPLGFAPKAGQHVTPLGFAASRGVIYSQDTDEQPTLYLQPNNKASINALQGKIHNAISGYKLLVWNGNIVDGLKGSGPEPRTAIGLNRSGNKLIIIVVDGRQPGYSEGVTEAELAQLMLEKNVHSAMNMDGGGSTTLVIEGDNGQPVVLNSPIHQGIPGNERPVANHLGFSARR